MNIYLSHQKLKMYQEQRTKQKTMFKIFHTLNSNDLDEDIHKNLNPEKITKFR